MQRVLFIERLSDIVQKWRMYGFVLVRRVTNCKLRRAGHSEVFRHESDRAHFLDVVHYAHIVETRGTLFFKQPSTASQILRNVFDRFCDEQCRNGHSCAQIYRLS